MPAVQAEQISDILLAGLRDLGEGKFVDITNDTQHHVLFTAMMRKQNVKGFTSGHGVQWDLMTDHNHSARGTGLFSQDNVNAPNVLAQAFMPWRRMEASYCFDHQEIDMNSGARQIVDLMKTRRYAAMVSMAEYVENRGWRVAASTGPHFQGVPYFIVKNATTGFNGDLPSGHTTVAGVDLTTIPRYKNYTAQYVNIDDTDLLPKWEEAADLTTFMAPVTRGVGSFDTGDKMGFYTNYTVYSALKRLLKAQNDDLGFDIDPMDGKPVFRGVKVQWVPALVSDTTDPIYGIQWGEFKIAVFNPWWMKETVISRLPGQHNVAGVFLDSTVQKICYNRRRQFVLATGTTMPDTPD
jgi:hypothetical protein